jgi:uncharacterized protein YdiU (UPF0061 family)
MPLSSSYRPDPAWLSLGPGFQDPVRAATPPQRTLRFRNDRAAATVGLGLLADREWLDHFASFVPLPDNHPEPLALRYHGHQFRHYNPDLGDGRGFLFAQLRDAAGRLLDLGTKGSGTTPWSRGGDGRLTLQGGVREVLAAELLQARGVDTCRILSVVETGEELIRHDEPSPTRSCVLVRLSHGHVRVGSFQRLATLGEADRARALFDYCARHFFQGSEPAAVLREIVARCAQTAAGWMTAGFVHGVLNTDNLNVTGESFDYGPWRWLPSYDPEFTAAYFDGTGLYSYERQPGSVLWNLRRLVDAWSCFADDAALSPVLEEFAPRYRSALQARWLARLGVASAGVGADRALIAASASFLVGTELSPEGFFHDWYGGVASAQRALSGPRGDAYRRPDFAPVRHAIERHAPCGDLDHPHLQREQPVHLMHARVEQIWDAIADDDDWAPFHDAVAEIRAAAGLLG